MVRSNAATFRSCSDFVFSLSSITFHRSGGSTSRYSSCS